MSTPASVSMEGIAVAPRLRWRALFAPSLTDFFFLCALAWMFMATDAGWQALLRDGDTGIHIRIGDLILASHKVPTVDPFSFSKPGQTWFAHEWLTDVLYAGLVQVGGLKALVLLTGVILALYNTILLVDSVKRGANSLAAIALVLAGTNAASVHFHTRPHVFTLLFLTLSAALIARDRSRPTPWIWLLVPLTVVWANMHGGFVVLFAVLGIAVVGSLVEGAAKRKMAVRYGSLLAGCGVASLLNPQGWKLHWHIVELMQTSWYKTHINEYQSPSFTSEAMLFFLVLLFLGLIAVYPLWRRNCITEALWILFFAYWALVSARNIPLFLIVALPLIALELTHFWKEAVETSSPQSTAGVLEDIARQTSRKIGPLSLWTAVFVAGVLLLTPVNRWPSDFSKEMFPLAMLHRHAAELAQARVLTEDQWADYLIYQSYPAQRVFLDGRSDYYGEEIGKAYLEMLQAGPRWHEMMARYSFNAVLCPVEWPLASLLKASSEWRVVDQDTDSVLFVKN